MNVAFAADSGCVSELVRRRNAAFRGLGSHGRLIPGNTYEVHWSRFDNGTNASELLEQVQSVSERSLRVSADAAEFLKVRIRTTAGDRPAWGRFIDV